MKLKKKFSKAQMSFGMLSFVIVCVIVVFGLMYLTTTDFNVEDSSSIDFIQKLFGNKLDKYNVDNVVKEEDNSIYNYNLKINQISPVVNDSYLKGTSFSFKVDLFCEFTSCKTITNYEWYINSKLVSKESILDYKEFNVGLNKIEVKTLDLKKKLLSKASKEIFIIE